MIQQGFKRLSLNQLFTRIAKIEDQIQQLDPSRDDRMSMYFECVIRMIACNAYFVMNVCNILICTTFFI